jgi:hypothetical protein
MSDAVIQIPPDSTGKKLDAEELTVGANTVYRERIQISGAADTDIAPVDGTAGLKVDLGSDNDVVLGAEAAEGGALPSTFVVVAGDDGTDTHPIQVDASGRLKISLDSQALPAGANNIGDVDILTLPGTAGEGSALPSVFVVVAGDDGSDTHPLQVSAGGDLKVTLDSESLPAGDNNIGNVDLASAVPTGNNKVGIVGKDIVTPYSGATGLTPVFVDIDAASSGNNTIVAAQGASNAILVLAVVLVASGGANTCTWVSGSTDISGGMGFAENGGYSLSSEFGVLKTGDNEALILNLSAATSVDGHLVYVVV